MVSSRFAESRFVEFSWSKYAFTNEDLSGRTAQLAKMQVLEIDENVKRTFKELYLMYFWQ